MKKREFECTWFDIKAACTICGEKPSLRKTGTCAVHAQTPYDPSRKNDWVDCYVGCLKHDPAARRAYIEHERNKARRLLTEPKVPVPLPTLNKLMVKARQAPEARTRVYRAILRELLASRDIVHKHMWDAIGIVPSTGDSQLTRERGLPIGTFFAVLDYIATYDAKQRDITYKENI